MSVLAIKLDKSRAPSTTLRVVPCRGEPRVSPVLRTPRKRGRIQVVPAVPPRILPCEAGEGDRRRRWRGRAQRGVAFS